MKILLCVGEGLGNVIETMPLVKVLNHNQIDFDILNLSYVDHDSAKWLFKKYAKVVSSLEDEVYHGRIELATTKGCLMHSERIDIPVLNDLQKQVIYRPDVNEIETYLSVARDMGLSFPKDIYDVELPQFREATEYDFIIHNGCSLQNPSEWNRKKYPNMSKLIAYLEEKGYSVGCIGAPQEYCGGKSLTGLDLPSTSSYMNSCKFFISNDTGTYHLAAAMKKRGLVLFTATSTIKNYHPTFHRTMKIVTAEVECQPCQYQDAWASCTASKYNNWKCRDIPIEKIIKEVKNAEVF